MRRIGLNGGFQGVDKRLVLDGCFTWEKDFFTRGLYDTDATVFFNAASITDATHKDATNALVISLKNSGVWAKMLAMYPFVGASASTHSYNLKNPSQFQITWGGTVTHNAFGITGSSTGFGNTGFVQTTGGWSNINASMGVYSRTNSQGSGIAIGGLNSYLYLRLNGTSLFSIGNSSAQSVTVADSLGLFIVQRESTTDTKLYKSATLLSTYNSACTLSAVNIDVLSYPQSLNGSRAEFETRNLSFAFISNALTQSEITTLNTAVQAFQTSLSRNV